MAILSPNDIHYFSAFIGISDIQAISSCINPQYTENEIIYQLEKTKAKLIICHPICIGKLLNIIKNGNLPANYPIIVLDTNGTNSVQLPQNSTLMSDILSGTIINNLDINAWMQTEEASFDAKNTVLTIPFSSGTTGKSKGVLLSHRNLMANVLQMASLEERYLVETEHQERATVLNPLPFFHIYGLTAGY